MLLIGFEFNIFCLLMVFFFGNIKYHKMWKPFGITNSVSWKFNLSDVCDNGDLLIDGSNAEFSGCSFLLLSKVTVFVYKAGCYL